MNKVAAPIPAFLILHSQLSTLHLKDRDTKAELNRRSQACDVLTGTGIRVAEMACRAEAGGRRGIEHQGIAPCIPV
jgi:hypothetical protein